MKNSILDVLFPRFCVGCGYVGTYVCPPCEAKMKRVKRARCFYCNCPSLLGLTHPRCQQKKGIDGHLSLYQYDGLFVKLLRESKYKGAHAVLRTLLLFFHQGVVSDLIKWNGLFKPLIVSVPLHSQRIRERGFNQSDIIIQHYFPSPQFLKGNILKRVVHTDHLAHIGNKSARKRHIQGAFSFIGDKPPEVALVVDDVVTSGSTILECSKVLKDVGVQTVLAFSLAKG